MIPSGYLYEQRLLWCSLLCLAATAYLAGLGGPFLFDDVSTFLGNAALQIAPSNLDQWRTASLSSDAGPLLRPLSMLTFVFHDAVSGSFLPVQVKAVNLCLHLATGVVIARLLVIVIRGLARTEAQRDHAEALALIAAALWLLHPLHVSTVLYAVQRMAQLSALFILLGLLVYSRFRERAVAALHLDDLVATAAWLLLLFLLGMLSKENAVVLPWLVVLLEVLVFRGTWDQRFRPFFFYTCCALLLLPVLALACASLLHMPDALAELYRGRPFDMSERLLTQARVLWQYVDWLLLPNINQMGFQHDGIAVSSALLAPPSTLLAILAWGAVALVALFLRRSVPWLLFGLAFFLIAQSVESTIIPLEIAYEHRNYLPSVGIILVAVMAWSTLFPRLPRRGLVALLVVVALALFLQTAARSYRWGDDLRLAQANYFMHPESPRSAYFLGNALLRRYREREVRAIPPAEAQEYAALGRHYLEVMHLSAPQDIGALVMLYYLDQAVFPDLSARTAWLSRIEQALHQRVLQPSDRNGLRVLAECMADGSCATPEARALALLRTIQRHHPELPDGFRLEFQYWQQRGRDAGELLRLAERLQRSSGHGVLNAEERISLLAKTDQRGKAYAAGVSWISGDSLRRWLTRQLAILG